MDSFCPKNRYNLIGCINSKLSTYDDKLTLDYPVIFLMLNEEIDRATVKQVIDGKRKKLAPYQRVMDLQEFKDFCTGQEPLVICVH